MKSGKILLCMTVLVCLAVQACAQDPLGLGSSGNSMASGGSSMGSSGDWISPNMGRKYPTNWMEGGFFYPGPFGVYPYNPSPYYSDFRLSSLAGMQKGFFQKNWTETLNYVRASSSMRVYQNGLWVTP
jgi:hypothetical protein